MNQTTFTGTFTPVTTTKKGKTIALKNQGRLVYSFTGEVNSNGSNGVVTNIYVLATNPVSGGSYYWGRKTIGFLGKVSDLI